MARIRTVKPELFSHDGLYEAEIEAGLPVRLAFAGLFTVADREGRFKWRPRILKVGVLPHDTIDFSRVLDALMTRGFVVKYADATGEEFGYIPSFLKHQVINNRESASVLPDPALCRVIAGDLTRDQRVPDACPTPLVQDQGEGKGKEGKGTTTTSPSPVGSEDPEAAAGESQASQQAEPDGEDFVLTPPAAKPVERKPKLPPCPVEKLRELYHEFMPNNPRTVKLNADRRRKAEARWREAAAMPVDPDVHPFGYLTAEEGLAAWRMYFEICNLSAFLTNKTPPRPGHENWKADFDFMISDTGFTKAIENRYH